MPTSWYSKVVKSMGSGARLPGFKPPLCYSQLCDLGQVT